MQQCMKLTGTNSSIGLIVLIDHAHRTSLVMHLFCPDADAAKMPLRSGRAAPCPFLGRGRDGRWPCGADAPLPKEEKDVFTKTNEEETFLGQLLKYMHKACSYVPVWPLWHPCKPIGRARKVCQSKDRDNGHAEGINIALSRPGGYGGAAAPVPFPNTAVKRPSADGTSSQDAGE